MSTSVPFPTIDGTGVVIPTEADIMAGLWIDFQAAFGGALNESPATPQGQLVASLASVIGASNDLLMLLVNQVDPAFSSGRMQDAIGRIYYLSRKGPLPTVVDCVCSGASGTVIPAGSLAQAADGTIYQSNGQATIPPAGNVTVAFSAIEDGPIPCPSGTLTTVYRIVAGWDSITNPDDGILGRDAETRTDFETRRQQSVALNATGILVAMRAAVLAVDDVADAYVTENSTASTVTIGGVSIPAHSLYVAVQGGTDADVARAIWKKKPPGCGYTGNTTVVVKDTDSGYDLPYPSYNVKFERPDPLPIFIAVELANNGLVPADAEDRVRAAVAAAFAGSDGGARARIGATLYASRFYVGIQNLGPWAQIVSLTIGTTSTPTGTDVTVPIDQMPTLDADDIAVTLA